MGSSDPYASARELGLMLGTPPPPEARVTRGNWFYAPHNRWAFSNMTLLVPTAEVSRGAGPVRPLPERLAPAEEVEALTVVDHAGVERTVGEMLVRTWSDAIVVLQHGNIVYERYDNDLRTDQIHLLASVTKSFTGLLTLLAIDEGRLDPDRPAVDYIPELADGVIADTTVGQVLDMLVAAEWDELDWLAHEAGPEQQDSQFLRFLRRSGTWVDSMHETDKGLLEFAATLQKAGEHGETFMYLTPATDILGWLLSRAYGVPYPQLLTERIWSAAVSTPPPAISPGSARCCSTTAGSAQTRWSHPRSCRRCVRAEIARPSPAAPRSPTWRAGATAPSGG